MNELKRVKLTKKFLMSFPDGIFLESNIQKNGKSIYAAAVYPLDKREEQWGMIKKAKVDGRLCNIFDNKDTMVQYYENRESNLAVLNMGKRVKLPKKVFLNLPEGSFIVSNSGFMDAPGYSSAVVSKNDREQQWQEIKKQKLQGTIFVVLYNENEKDKYLAARSNIIQDQMSRKSINFAF